MDAITLPEVKECCIPVLPRKINYEEETDNGEEAESNDYVKAIEEKKRRNKKITKTPPLPKKRSVQEEMLELQRLHVESFQRSEEKYFDFMKNMISEQQKAEESETKKDSEFFLELAKVFSQK